MSYSRIARFYKLIESVTIGRPLLDARLAHLDRLAEGTEIRHALLVGEGNGTFLLPFAQRFPNTQITVIDESPAMLKVARARLESAGIATARIAPIDLKSTTPVGQADHPSSSMRGVQESSSPAKGRSPACQVGGVCCDNRITFRRADMTSEQLPAGRYDLIVTLFFFDNFDAATVRKIVPVLERASTPAAQWLLSDFQIPADGWRRVRAQIWLTILYAFFRCVAAIPARRVPPTEAILTTTDFKPVARTTVCGEMLYSTLYQR